MAKVIAKEMYTDYGAVKKIASNGMAIFEMAAKNKDGSESKNKKMDMQLAIKAQKGDRVVKLADGGKKFMIIPEDEWAAMPATEKEAKSDSTETSSADMAKVFQKIEALENENKALKEAVEGVKKDA